MSAGRISSRYLSFSRAMWFLVQLRAGALGDAHAAAGLRPRDADARRLLVLGVEDRDVGDVDRALALDHADGRVGPRRVRALVALDHVQALDVDPRAPAVDPDDLAGLALLLAGDDDHLVVGADLHLVVRFVSVDRKLPSRGEVGRIPSLEVVMRPPSVFVRDLLPEEGNRLKRLSRKASSEVKRERALIVWASATRMSPQQIAALVGSDESHVRKVIHAFNERGFDSLDPEQRRGRPRRITDEQRSRIVAVAGAPPDTLGGPATTRV